LRQPPHRLERAAPGREPLEPPRRGRGRGGGPLHAPRADDGVAVAPGRPREPVVTLLALLLLAAPARAEDTVSFGWAPGWRGTTEVVLTRTIDGEPARPPLHAAARVTVKRDRATG